MRYRVEGRGWPLGGGAWLCPTGTVIDADVDEMWSRLAAGMPPPINATPLDDETYYAQRKAYPEQQHLLGPAVPPSQQTKFKVK
jgi:hypothetical protein